MRQDQRRNRDNTPSLWWLYPRKHGEDEPPDRKGLKADFMQEEALPFLVEAIKKFLGKKE